MSAIELCRLAHAAGLRLRVNGELLGVSPASQLTPELRALLAAHKVDLLLFLNAMGHTTAELVDTAMRRCDELSDGPTARAEMERDCRATPLHLQHDLLDHFRSIRLIFRKNAA